MGWRQHSTRLSSSSGLGLWIRGRIRYLLLLFSPPKSTQYLLGSSFVVMCGKCSSNHNLLSVVRDDIAVETVTSHPDSESVWDWPGSHILIHLYYFRDRTSDSILASLQGHCQVSRGRAAFRFDQTSNIKGVAKKMSLAQNFKLSFLMNQMS